MFAQTVQLCNSPLVKQIILAQGKQKSKSEMEDGKRRAEIAFQLWPGLRTMSAGWGKSLDVSVL